MEQTNNSQPQQLGAYLSPAQYQPAQPTNSQPSDALASRLNAIGLYTYQWTKADWDAFASIQLEGMAAPDYIMALPESSLEAYKTERNGEGLTLANILGMEVARERYRIDLAQREADRKESRELCKRYWKMEMDWEKRGCKDPAGLVWQRYIQAIGHYREDPKRPAVQSVAEKSLYIRRQVANIYINVVTQRGCTLVRSEQLTREADAVARWIDERPKKGLLLTGGVGTGKTTWARVLSRMLAQEYASVTEPCKTISADMYCQDVKQRPAAIAEAVDARVLIIDDLGCEPTLINEYGSKTNPIVSLMVNRCDNRKPLIITTNLTGTELADRYGPRCFDRLKEMCLFIQFDNNKKSYRK